MRLTYIVAFIVGIALSNSFFAQTEAQSDKHNGISPNYSKAILANYTLEQLQELRDFYPVQHATVLYYYNSSYTLTTYPANLAFDASEFDVFKYENYRLRDEYYTYEDEKHGFTLVLTPINQLTYKFPIHY